MNRVLLVEDESALRKLIRTFLKAENYIVEETDSVEGAKRIIATGLVEVIVADFKLGAGTATELYQWLVDKDLQLKDRFIVVSGWPDLEGFPYFLSKPFHLTELVSTIKLVLSDHPVDDGVATVL